MMSDCLLATNLPLAAAPLCAVVSGDQGNVPLSIVFLSFLGRQSALACPFVFLLVASSSPTQDALRGGRVKKDVQATPPEQCWSAGPYNAKQREAMGWSECCLRW